MASQTKTSKTKCVHCGTGNSSKENRCSNCLMLTSKGLSARRMPLMIVTAVVLGVLLLGTLVSVGFFFANMN